MFVSCSRGTPAASMTPSGPPPFAAQPLMNSVPAVSREMVAIGAADIGRMRRKKLPILLEPSSRAASSAQRARS